jgi:hypothetical protein
MVQGNIDLWVSRERIWASEASQGDNIDCVVSCGRFNLKMRLSRSKYQESMGCAAVFVCIEGVVGMEEVMLGCRQPPAAQQIHVPVVDVACGEVASLL